MPRPPASAADAVKPTVGKGWEAWVQNDWHGVEVLRVMRDTCMIRWDWDGSEDEIWNSYVRPASSSANKSETTAKTAETRALPAIGAAAAAATHIAAPEAPAAPVAASAAEEQSPCAVGARVEGLYGHEWFDAVVVSFEQDGTVRIKWDYNGSESSVAVSEVRAKSPPPPQAPSPSRSPLADERARDAAPRQAPESRRSYSYPDSTQHAQPAAAQTPEPRTRDYAHPSPLDASKQAVGRSWAPEEPAKAAVKPEDVRRILELIPEDAPAEVRSYLQSLIPATAVH